MIPSEVMMRILAGYELPVMGIHGLPHWGRVLETGLRLAPTTNADTTVVALFAVFHDSRRLNDGTDPDHGKRGAELASHLRSLVSISDEQHSQLTYACTHHTDGMTDGDPTVRTCWDADRLDLWRVGITPHGRWLCTDAAREAKMLEWTRVRSLGDHVPDCALEWLRLEEQAR